MVTQISQQPPNSVLSLALAVITSSEAPLVLLDSDLNVIVASASFCEGFDIDCADIAGQPFSRLGGGEWDAPELLTLLRATASGGAAIKMYELDLLRADKGPRQLVLNAHKLDYADLAQIRLILSVSDVTDARATERLKDNHLRETIILLQEVRHRVANSLQIIASVLLRGARTTLSEDARGHLRNAHHRIMSVSALERQLAPSVLGDVVLRPYMVTLCESIGTAMIHEHDQISLEVLVDESAVEADVSVSLGLMVTELVINALKHAFPDGREGRITVDYRAAGSGWVLEVGDNGVGRSADSKPAAPGLGTTIVAALAKQRDAVVEIGDARPGTIVSIIHAPAVADRQSPAVPEI